MPLRWAKDAETAAGWEAGTGGVVAAEPPHRIQSASASLFGHMKSGIAMQNDDTTSQGLTLALPYLGWRVYYGGLVASLIYFDTTWQKLDEVVSALIGKKGQDNPFGTGLRPRLIRRKWRCVLLFHALSARFRVVVVTNGFIPSNNTQQNRLLLEPLKIFPAHTQRLRLPLSSQVPRDPMVSHLAFPKALVQNGESATMTNASMKLTLRYSSVTMHQIINLMNCLCCLNHMWLTQTRSVQRSFPATSKSLCWLLDMNFG